MTRYKRPGMYQCYRCGRSIMAENEIIAKLINLVYCDNCKEEMKHGLGEWTGKYNNINEVFINE